MKSLRRIALTALVTFSAFGTITYTSCNKDECKDVVCQNAGTCNSENGSCSCATGYEGTNCETAMRAKFIKTWTASDKEVGGNNLPTYTTAIAAGATIAEVRISDFSNDYFTNDVIATVNGNTISIASQTPDNDGFKVEGTGTLNTTDNTISWSYKIMNPLNQEISYTGTWQ